MSETRERRERGRDTREVREEVQERRRGKLIKVNVDFKIVLMKDI